MLPSPPALEQALAEASRRTVVAARMDIVVSRIGAPGLDCHPLRQSRCLAAGRSHVVRGLFLALPSALVAVLHSSLLFACSADASPCCRWAPLWAAAPRTVPPPTLSVRRRILPPLPRLPCASTAYP